MILNNHCTFCDTEIIESEVKPEQLFCSHCGTSLFYDSIERLNNLQKLKCLSCGYEFEVYGDQIENDGLGWHTSCPECGSSFDVDVKLLPTGALVKVDGDWIGVIDGNDAENSEALNDVNYYICPLEKAEKFCEWSDFYEMKGEYDIEVIEPLWGRYNVTSMCNELLIEIGKSGNEISIERYNEIVNIFKENQIEFPSWATERFNGKEAVI